MLLFYWLVYLILIGIKGITAHSKVNTPRNRCRPPKNYFFYSIHLKVVIYKPEWSTALSGQHLLDFGGQKVLDVLYFVDNVERLLTPPWQLILPLIVLEVRFCYRLQFRIFLSFDFEHYLLSTLSSFLMGDFNFKITVLSRKYTYIAIYVFDDHLLLLTNKSEAIFPQSFSIMLLESSSGLYSIILYITLRPFWWLELNI